MWQLGKRDAIGLGWRIDLGPSILSNIDKIDVLEVIIDDYFNSSRVELRSLNTLARQIPVLYHGVGLGLASSLRVDQRRLEKLARILDVLSPEIWSEHLAFVRAGNREIGHLAAPPRTNCTLDGALENLFIVKKTIGSCPVLENIATLIDPPGSKMSEPQWVTQIVNEGGGTLLLDLHNLYANALNFGFEPISYLKSFPLDRVNLVHLSGGKWIKEPAGFESRPKGELLLDDHIHDVPEEVYDLLNVLGKSVPQPLTVIIERDGEYPAFQLLLAQVQRTRNVLMEARKHQEQQVQKIGGSLECTII